MCIAVENEFTLKVGQKRRSLVTFAPNGMHCCIFVYSARNASIAARTT